jgi:hypothetical protein
MKNLSKMDDGMHKINIMPKPSAANPSSRLESSEMEKSI